MKTRRFYTHAIIIATMLTMFGAAGYAQPVDIPDANLRATISEALNGAPITQASMRRLTALDARDRQIVRLTGLEYATNLKELSLVYNNISDLTPLTGLRLTELWLWDNLVTDLSPLFNMTTLTHLDLGYNRISDISPLDKLTRLKWLELSGNQISNITPLSNLFQLTLLEAYSNQITDVTPLANLTRLEHLKIQYNAISDITPLSNLSQLTLLEAYSNQITDVTPLANLTRLEHLKIEDNAIVDHSPLDSLALTRFVYDQTCDMPPVPLQERLDNRTFPSVFSAWGGLGWSSVLNQPHLSGLEQMAQHDLYFCCLMFDHEFFDTGDDWLVRGDLKRATQIRDDYIALNPNMVFLVGIGAIWKDLDTFPADSPYWLRDEQGEILPAWDSGLVNLNHPYVQKRIIDRVVAVSQCGLYDGIFFDGWSEWHANRRGVLPGMETILKGIRERVREDFLIMVNTNTWTAPVSAPYINGLFLESGFPGDSNSPEDLEGRMSELEDTLRWAETTLRSPQINGLEGWGFANESPDSPLNLRWMRVVTTLSLTFTNGYVLYNTGKDHNHYWYNFWDADLGQPVGEKAQVYDGRDGLYIREYTNGWAVYNHSGAPQLITLPEEVQGVASGWVNVKHALPNLDGEMYLRVTPKNPADVNRDGVVNILDLTLVAQGFGSDEVGADVNGDGVINVFDLVFVANAF